MKAICLRPSRHHLANAGYAKHGQTGWLCDIGDEAEFARSVALLHAQPVQSNCYLPIL
jgi:hypothetical protein